MSGDDWRLTAHAIDALEDADTAEVRVMLDRDADAAATVDDVQRLDAFARTQLARRDFMEGAADGMRQVTGPWDQQATAGERDRRWRLWALAAGVLLAAGVGLVVALLGGGDRPGPGAMRVEAPAPRVEAPAPRVETPAPAAPPAAPERVVIVLKPPADDVEITVNGERLGVGPQPVEGEVGKDLTVQLTAPDGRVLVQRVGLREHLAVVALEAFEPLPRERVAVTPSGEGKVRINARPWAQITVDGKPAGTTPRLLKLSAGTHKIVLKKGSQSKTLRIAVKPGATRTVFHDFSK